jgi:hypothetical protein
MELSNALAAIALLISTFSAWVSYRAHRQATETNERMSRLNFAREKSEFLVRIETSRKRFERTQQRISWLIAQIECQSETIRASLNGEVELLKSDADHLRGCLRQSSALWDETYEMSQEGLAHHKPRYLGLIEDDEAFAAKAIERANDTEKAFNHELKGPS